MTPQSFTAILKKHIYAQHQWAAGETRFAPPALMVRGKQGIGKTSVVFQVAQSLGCDLVVVEGATQDPVEVGGLLDIDRTQDGQPRTVRAISEIVAKVLGAKRPVVLCFDDFHQAARMIQAAFTSATDIRRTIGGSKLPDTCYILGTMNLANEKTVYHDMPTNMHTRFRHLFLSADLDGWCDRAIADGVSPELVAAVREQPELLHEVDTSDPAKASSTGRTLYNADAAWKMRGELDDHTLQELICGDIGSVPGVKLHARLTTMADMPRFDEIVKAPRKTPIPKLAGAKYALARSLALRADVDTVEPVLTYLERLGNEHLLFAVRFRVKQEMTEPQSWEGKTLWRMPKFVAWLEDHKDVLDLIVEARAGVTEAARA